MNKIRCLEKILTHVRFFNTFKINATPMRYSSTGKDSEGETKDSVPLESSGIEKEAQAKAKESIEISATETKLSGIEKEAEAKENIEISETEIRLSGFAESFERFSHIDDKEPETPQTFASLIRHSKFVDLGDPEEKLVIGEIFHIVGDDLYIDFGWKFHCVCRKPIKNGQYFVRGAKVRLRVKDLELSSKFLGAMTDITLLEADCTLMGLISSPLQRAEQKAKTGAQNIR